MQAVVNKPLKFPPGSASSYCNVGYVLLGLVIEAASGKSYTEFLQEHIFGPLGMKETGVASKASVIPHRAYGYWSTPSGAQPADEDDLASFSALSAAGAIYSTGADLARWLIALHGGRVLKPASYQEMITPVLDGYAYGLTVSTQYGQKDIGHLGDVPGFHTATEYFPASKTGIVVICNLKAAPASSNVSPGVFSIDNELMALATNGRAITRSSGEEAPIGAAALKSLTGDYSLQAAVKPMTIRVIMESGRLMLVPQGAEKVRFTLRAESATRFYAVESPIEAEFSEDEHDNLNMMVFNYAVETATQWSRALN